MEQKSKHIAEYINIIIHMGKLHGKILHFLDIRSKCALFWNVGAMHALFCAQDIVDGKKGLVNILLYPFFCYNSRVPN